MLSVTSICLQLIARNNMIISLVQMGSGVIQVLYEVGMKLLVLRIDQLFIVNIFIGYSAMMGNGTGR